MTRLNRTDVVEVAWAVSVVLVALGTALALACVRSLSPWRWS